MVEECVFHDALALLFTCDVVVIQTLNFDSRPAAHLRFRKIKTYIEYAHGKTHAMIEEVSAPGSSLPGGLVECRKKTMTICANDATRPQKS